MKMNVSSIKVGDRIREDYGDLESLKNSIAKYGLINPIIVDQNNNLIAGARRLEAVKQLGWEKVDVRIIDVKNKYRKFEIEMHENVLRKNFTEEEIEKSIRIREQLLKKPFFKRIWIAIKKVFAFLFGWIVKPFRKK